jgi:hypothetical protein
VNSFVSAKPNTRNIVCYAFSERYKFDQFNESLLPELKWLKKVIELLEEKSKSLKGKISGYQLLSHINGYFIPAMETLEQYEVNMQS